MSEEGKQNEGENDHSSSLKGECSPEPDRQNTVHLNGHVMHDKERLSGKCYVFINADFWIPLSIYSLFHLFVRGSLMQVA